MRSQKSDRDLLKISILVQLLPIGVIVFASPNLVKFANFIAIYTGFGQTFVGSTLIAFTTSLPELVAAISTFRIKPYDLALGNIFGSIAFNILLFLPLDYLYDGPLLSSLNTTHLITLFSIIITTSITVLGKVSKNKNASLLRMIHLSSEFIILATIICLLLFFSSH